VAKVFFLLFSSFWFPPVPATATTDHGSVEGVHPADVVWLVVIAAWMQTPWNPWK
jgi:hypothetical protein